MDPGLGNAPSIVVLQTTNFTCCLTRGMKSKIGGSGRIRTHGTISGTSHFKCDAL